MTEYNNYFVFPSLLSSPNPGYLAAYCTCKSLALAPNFSLPLTDTRDCQRIDESHDATGGAT